MTQGTQPGISRQPKWGREFEREWTHVYVTESLCCLKLSQYC